MHKLFGGHGPTEEVPLFFCTVPSLKKSELILRFDARGHHVLLEVGLFQCGTVSRWKV
jgi:hypothetical protein